MRTTVFRSAAVLASIGALSLTGTASIASAAAPAKKSAATAFSPSQTHSASARVRSGGTTGQGWMTDAQCADDAESINTAIILGAYQRATTIANAAIDGGCILYSD